MRMTGGTDFVHRFLPAYGAILGCTLPVAMVAAEVDFGIAQHPWKAVTLLLFTTALAALLTPAWTRMRVTVSAEGLTCAAVTGVNQFARWEEMTWVRPNRVILGLPYLRIGLTDGRSPIWLPLFLVDMPRFATLVLSHAGASHPVAVALSTRSGVRQQQADGGAARHR
jgi:hypothetical protein